VRILSIANPVDFDFFNMHEGHGREFVVNYLHFGRGWHFRGMRRWIALFLALMVASVARGEEAKVLKVFPQFLDSEGRHTLSPSLFARDGYQFHLLQHPKERSGLRIAVQWKSKGTAGANLRMRVEMRGLRGNTMRTKTLEKSVTKNGWLSNWSEARLTGDDYTDFGELVAWRVSIWDGEKELSSQQSFLWDGVLPPQSQN
jgi:hypothetical protein